MIHRLRKHLFAAGALSLILALLAACGAPGAAPGGAPAEPGAAAGEPSTAILIIPEEPASLNQYHAVAAIVRQVADAVSAPLATPDENGDFVPVLAAELPTLENGGLSEDFTTVTWKLKPDLKWSDGEPLTSDDIKFTWEALTTPEAGNVLSLDMEKIASIETPDDLTAVITYSEPTLSYLSQWLYGLLPRHATGDPADMLTWEWNRNPVSAGPYVVSEWNSGDSIVMERNPYYHEAGKPSIDRLIFKIVPDPGAQIAMMAQGEGTVHLWPGLTEAEYNPQVEGKATLQEIPGQWNMTLFFNLSQPFDDDPGATPPHPVLGDLRVRQAIAHATDYDLIVNEINPGNIPIATPFAYGWYKCEAERKYPFDLAKANALLDEAGWTDSNGDGVREKDGVRLSVQLNGYTNFQPLVKLEEALVEMWKKAGIETTIQNDDFSIIFGSYEDGAPRQLGNFDILIYDTSTGLDPQAAILSTYHSAGIPSAENPSGDNSSRWVNAQADALIEQAGATLDLEARRDAYCQLSDLITTELPRLNLFLFTEGYGASTRLGGNTVNMWGSLTWDVANWTLE